MYHLFCKILSRRYISCSFKNIKDCNSNAKKLKENTDGAIEALENKIEGLTEDLANYQNISRAVRNGEDMDQLDVASLGVDLDNIKRIDAKSKRFLKITTFLYLFAYLHSFVDFHSCKDYAESGIDVDGYYYMFLNGSSSIESIYCNFKAIEYGTCHDYYLKNFTEAGEYTVYLKSRPYKVNCDFSKGNFVFG